MAYRDFSEMSAWQKAIDLSVKIYSKTQGFPPEEKYCTTTYIRRAANSVVHNIAECFGRFEKRSKTRFYKISRGSTYEVQSQILASFALDSFQKENQKDKVFSEYKNITSELNAFIKTLES